MWSFGTAARAHLPFVRSYRVLARVLQQVPFERERHFVTRASATVLMASVHSVRNRVKPNQTARARTYKSPLDKAYAHELDWPKVSGIFTVARGITDPSFVYLTGEQDGGPVKIGVAKDPVSRIRGMQTGNSRRLRVERVLIGDRDIEHLLHQIWRHRAIVSPTKVSNPDAGPGTEWFEPEIRDELFPIIDTAAGAQVDHIVTLDGDIEFGDLERIVREAHGAHGMVPSRPDEVRLLGKHGGYVTPRRIRV